jgi:hypothetical protein
MDLCAHDQVLSDATDRSDAAEWHRSPQGPLSGWYGKRLLSISASSEASKEITLEVFESLRAAWHREYGLTSSFTQITRTPSYRKIVNLGDKVLPLIFRDLEQRPEPDHWFDALVEITKANPVLDRDRGYARRMAKAWLKWARANGKYG